MQEIPRLVSESAFHYEARRIFWRYLNYVLKKLGEGDLELCYEFPYEYLKFKAKADFAMIKRTYPRILVKIWVEVQETSLTRKEWFKKITTPLKVFKIERFFIVLTEHSKDDIVRIIKLKEKLKEFSPSTTFEVFITIFKREEPVLYKMVKFPKEWVKITFKDSEAIFKVIEAPTLNNWR